MIETPVRTSGASDVENLRAELARSDALAGTVLPILRHLLSNESGAVFGDEVIARVRAMLAHLTGELLDLMGVPEAPAGAEQEALFKALLGTPLLLSHLHAQALEWALTIRLEARAGVDPVIPPLLQHWIALPLSAAQSLAGRMLAAQAKWCQSQRRMTITLDELPGEVLHATLLAIRTAMPFDPRVEHAERAIRGSYDEGASRLALAARLVSEVGDGEAAVLELEHAGAALFITALGQHATQPRDGVALAMQEPRATRLALMLIAAGLLPHEAERQIGLVHEHSETDSTLDGLKPEEAAAILHNGPRG